MTRPVLHSIAVFLCFMSLASCDLLKDVNPDYLIRVSGTNGLKFSGHYSIAETKALPEPINVHGVVPGEYNGKGAVAMCYFRKLDEKGFLKVEILKDGKILSESETNIPYGFVSLKTPLPERNTILDCVIKRVFGKK